MASSVHTVRDQSSAVLELLRQVGSIADLHVVRNLTEDDDFSYTAFAALSRNDSSQAIMKRIAQSLAELQVKLELYLVTNIPRLQDGRVDQDALRRAAHRLNQPQPGIVFTTRHSTEPAGYNNLPSQLDGKPMLDAVSPTWRLDEMLRRAATEAQGRGIRFLGRDGGEQWLSYPEICDLAQNACAGLRQAGLKTGSFAMIAIEAKKDFLIAFWGCVFAGVVPLPCAVPVLAESHEWLKFKSAWEMLDGPTVITSAQDASTLSPLVKQLQPACRLLEIESLAAVTKGEDQPGPRSVDGVALLLMTSGSSGRPKLVMQTHRTLRAYCSGSSRHNRFTADDVSLNWFPFDHVGGLVMFHLRDTWLTCEQIQAPTAAVLSRPLRWLDWIDRYRVSITWAPNFAFALVNQFEDEIKRRTWDLSCLRFVLNGGEAIVPEQARRFLRLLRPHKLPVTAMHPAWGMSETCSGVTYSDDFAIEPADEPGPFVAVGKPVPGFSLRVVDSTGNVVPQGHTGELEVRGEQVTPGYYRNREANSEAFCLEGWFRTGDLAVVRDGQLVIVGRSKDILIINGRNYACSEIEAVVEQVPGVKPTFVAAVGVREAGAATERLAVAFVIEPQFRLRHDEVLETVRRTLVQKLQCASPILVSVEEGDIPKTSIGKIRRAEVRQNIEQRRRAGKPFEDPAGIPEPTRSTFVSEHAAHATDIAEVAQRGWQPKRPLVTANRPEQFLLVAPDRNILMNAEGVLRRLGSAAVSVCARSGNESQDGSNHFLDLRLEEEWDPVLRGCMSDRGGIKNILFFLDDTRHHGQSLLSTEIQGGLRSLHSMFRSLSRHRSEGRVRLRVICGRALADEKADPADAGALGAINAWLRSLAAELPWLLATTIGLPGRLEEHEAQNALAAELTVSDVDGEVAYTPAGRLVPMLSSAVDARSEIAIENGGLYMITGGLGGVGQHLAEHLIRRFKTSLLLIGRTPIEAKRAEEIEGLSRLESLGDVLYQAADISDLQKLRQLRTDAEEQFKKPLRGIFHLAGILGEAPALKQPFSEIEKVLYPKISGTNTVLELMADREPGLVVIFSSVTGIWGGAGLAAHAAASAYQLGFAGNAGSSRRHKLFSIAWSGWANTGQSQGRSDAQLAAERGLLNLSPSRALELLDFILTQQPGGWIAGLDRSHPSIAWQYIQEPKCYHRSSSNEPPAVQNHENAMFPPQADRLANGNPEACTSGTGDGYPASASGGDIVNCLRRLWCEALKLDDINDDENFFDLGGHSLIVPSLLEQINTNLRAGIQTVDVFRYPTVRTLSERILELLSKHDLDPQPAGSLR